MPRRSRIDAPGSLHHVMVRGIERGAVFRNDADREVWAEGKSRPDCGGAESAVLLGCEGAWRNDVVLGCQAWDIHSGREQVCKQG